MQLKSQKEVGSGTGHWMQHVLSKEFVTALHEQSSLTVAATLARLFPLSPWGVIAEHGVIWDGKSLWSFGLSGANCVPSQTLAHPQPTHWCSKAVQELFSCNWNTGVLSTLVWSQKSNPPPYRLSWRKLTPSQPHSVHQDRKMSMLGGNLVVVLRFNTW